MAELDTLLGSFNSGKSEKYYVANSDSRKVMYGPFDTKEQADAVWHHICAKGIPGSDHGAVERPRVAVIHSAALVPSESGNHFQLPVASTPEQPLQRGK